MAVKAAQNGAYNLPCVSDVRIRDEVDEAWEKLSSEYESVYNQIPDPTMERSELSFHEQVKLLGYLCLDLFHRPGDILEIGVWKGKSLSFMGRLSQKGTKIVGVDPCEITGQKEELSIFINTIIPEATVLVDYSERAVRQVAAISKKYKIIHIDGGHLAHHVWADFLLYSKFLAEGGYLVFDDYADVKSSPEVKTAVDEMYRSGMFDNFEVLGPIDGFLNSFVLKN